MQTVSLFRHKKVLLNVAVGSITVRSAKTLITSILNDIALQILNVILESIEHYHKLPATRKKATLHCVYALIATSRSNAFQKFVTSEQYQNMYNENLI